MANSEKTNGSSQGNGTRETLARIARLISAGDGREASDDHVKSGDDGTTIEIAEGINLPPDLGELISGDLLEALPAGLAIFQDGQLITANSAFALAFGYRDSSEIPVQNGKNGIFPGKPGKLDKLFSKARKAPGGCTQLPAQTRSGRRFDVPVAVHEMSSESGEQAQLIVLHPKQGAVAEKSKSDSPDSAQSDTPVTRADAPPKLPKKKKRKKSKPKDANLTKLDRESKDDDDQDIMSDFLATVSHELRTPLNSIIGFAELMKDEQLGPIENERYRGYIRDIHDSGIYALSLVNDLLDISKIKSGEFELNFAAVDLEDVIAESVQSMEPQAQRRRVILRTSVDDNLPNVLADRRSLRQIILNLVSNAIKFTQPGGQVIVSLLETEAGGVRMRVRDTGVGMSKTEVALAMKPYKRIKGAQTENQPGTGLGLPLTRALVEANRARFKVRSSAGRGTRVDVTFPRERVAER